MRRIRRRLRITTLRLVRRVRNNFLIGVIVAIPLGITVWALSWIFGVIDGILQPTIRLITDRTITGIGFVITILALYLIGLVSSSVIGQKLISLGEALLTRVPFVRPLYTSVKEVVARFSEPKRSNQLQVALVEYPRKGITSLAFITSEFSDKNGKKFLTLLIPTAPNPLSGFVIVAAENEVTRTNIRPDTAMRMIISCGALVPQEVSSRLATIKSQPPLSPDKTDKPEPDSKKTSLP